MNALRTALTLAALASASAPATLLGQAAEPTPFHARQWGADFTIIGGFTGAGFIHFRNPTHAMVADLGVGIQSTTPSGGGPGTNTMSATLRLGMRRYRPLTRGVLGFGTLGIDVTHTHQFRGGPGPLSSNGWGGGIFGNVGASWLVTPHLGIGADWGVTVGYVHETGPLANVDRQWTVGLGQLQLTGQLYF